MNNTTTGEARVRIIGLGDDAFSGRVISSGPTDVGGACYEFTHTSSVNNGHIVYAKLHDPYFNIIDKLVGNTGASGDFDAHLQPTYFKFSRRKPVAIKTAIEWVPYGTGDQFNITPYTLTYILGLRAYGDEANHSFVEFIAIDPASWLLAEGNASGKAYTGRISDVIRKVLDDYIVSDEFDPGILATMIGDTVDSKHNTWHMMRQDPKSFIMSLLDWSTSISKKETRWIVSSDSTDFTIQEQSNIISEHKYTYKYNGAGNGAAKKFGDIYKWGLLGDHSLSLSAHKIVTHGISSVSGAYFDKVTDTKENTVYVKDLNTANKYKAKTFERNAPTKKDDKKEGYASYRSIPEFNGGEIGLRYDEYMDGMAKGTYLNIINNVLRAKFTILGHGIWGTNRGLGVDTIGVDWKNIDGLPYFMDGNWIVDGWEHKFHRLKGWFTDLQCSRIDFDASANPVPNG